MLLSLKAHSTDTLVALMSLLHASCTSERSSPKEATWGGGGRVLRGEAASKHRSGGGGSAGSYRPPFGRRRPLRCRGNRSNASLHVLSRPSVVGAGGRRPRLAGRIRRECTPVAAANAAQPSRESSTQETHARRTADRPAGDDDGGSGVDDRQRAGRRHHSHGLRREDPVGARAA